MPTASRTGERTSAPVDPRRGAYISWAKLRRADTIAEQLGIPSHTVRYFYRGTPPLLTLLKYFLQALKTLWILLRDRPRVVLVTSPPVFAVAPVYLYALLFRRRFVIDHHSGCFLEPHWLRWSWLQRFFARRAALNLPHNRDNAAFLEEWGARSLVFPSLPPEIREPARNSNPTPGRPLVVYICSWKSDEPAAELIEAARRIPEVDVCITGKAPAAVASGLPSNVRLTGYLGDDAYNELLAGARALVALTTRPGTLLYGAQEAIALGKPLVLSRSPTLEALFTGGTVFSENTPEALASAVRDGIARSGQLEQDMREFRERYQAEGAARLAELRATVGIP